MENVSNCSSSTKAFGKLYKRSVWPVVCLFVISTVILVSLMFGIVSLFTDCVTSMRMGQLKENCDRIERAYNSRLAESEEPSQIIESLKGYLNYDEEICVTDNNYNILYRTGVVFPDFESRIHLDYGTEYDFYQDRRGETVVSQADFNLDLIKIMSDLMSEMNKTKPGEKYNFRDKDALRTACWFEYPLASGKGKLYVREVFFIRMQETVYISAVAVISLILVLVLLIVVFLNFMGNVRSQKRVASQLFTDVESDGNSWTYFLVQGARTFQSRANRRKDYAVVAIHLNKYRNYCSCYGMEAGEEIIRLIAGYFKVKLDKDEVYARHSDADFALLLRYTDKDSFVSRVNNIVVELMGLKSDQRLFYSVGAYVIQGNHLEHIGEHRNEHHDSGCMCNLCNEKDRKNINIEQAYNYAFEAATSTLGNPTDNVTFFSKALIDEQMWERKVEDSMEQALRNDEFIVYYQPKYDPVDNRLVAAEALVRWNSPTEGIIPPGRFIPLFEKNGFITKLDDYMFASVAKQQAEWKLKGMKTVPVSVNLSRVHFAQDDIVHNICGIIDSYGIEHKMVEIEVTESAFIENKSQLVSVVDRLKNHGFVISMDDFGSGYSSLNTLKELPLDVVKIDRDFFVGEGYDDKGKLIVSSVIKLAKSMKMKVVAEGVEVKDQIDFLVKENCDMIQGYYYAKPMPAEEFAQLVARDA